MVTMEIAVHPIGTGNASLSDYVADVIEVAKRRGVKYEITGMGTNLEGDLNTLFDIAREMHEASFRRGAPRVFTLIKVDDRRDKDLTLEYKRRRAAEKVGDA
ncbi:MAG TPA: MTH1187 family thiamine-binding protein [Armatimonadota bacterium]|nr:MTH1187 family thiamine-binding protein [Armatimonadota bacterium]HOJ23270.1 MTH1187 family thiamine-binding protein [Armatimonadota bacterium]HOM83743.1 MTH1187 family thiamine-binding protein [Armatimonadota bacterium]HPO73235.1 MTH1187 family thiamine-binding protein [Armatimonadota bacterium]HPT96454.1 MTH1187 family thiamine-binding protein [Armatimonadota bacterium]